MVAFIPLHQAKIMPPVLRGQYWKAVLLPEWVVDFQGLTGGEEATCFLPACKMPSEHLLQNALQRVTLV